MPMYQYKCSECKEIYEKEQSMKDDPLKYCPMCEKDTLFRKPYTNIAMQFNGPGFYVNDYKGK